MRSAERQPRSCPAWRQVSSRPKRPTSPSCPLMLSAPVQAPVRVRGARFARPNLVRAAAFFLPRRRPQAWHSGLGGRVAAPTPLQLCRDPRPPPGSSSAPSCALAVMAEPFGTACYSQWAARCWGTPVPGDWCTCPSSTCSFPPCPALLRYGTCEPAVTVDSFALLSRPRRGARGWAALLLGTLLLPGFQLCKDSSLRSCRNGGPPAPLTTHVRWNWGARAPVPRN